MPGMRHPRLLPLLVVCFAVAAQAQEECTPALADGVHYAVAGTIGTLEAYDFDADGDADLVATVADNTVAVLTNRGDGFTPGPRFALSHSGLRALIADVDDDGRAEYLAVGPAGVTTFFTSRTATRTVTSTLTGAAGRTARFATGDFTGDGKADLVFTQLAGDGGIARPFKGNGDGTFTPVPTITISSIPNGLDLGDVTGDGKEDLIVAVGSNGVEMYPADGLGAFGARTSMVNNRSAVSVAAADVDGDGRDDVISRGGNTLSHAVLRSSSAYAAESITCAETLRVVDLDGDGKLDTVGSSVEVCRNAGDGTFVRGWRGTTALTVAVADFDRDGKADLATASASDNVTVYYGNGDGTFRGATKLRTNTLPRQPLTGDLNNDGRLDIVSTGNSVEIFIAAADGTFQFRGDYSSSFTAVIGEFTGDAHRDILGPRTLWVGNGTGEFAAQPIDISADVLLAADLNRDGRSDVVGASRHGAITVLLAPALAPVLYEAGHTPGALAVVDVNSDSIPDVLTAGKEPAAAGGTSSIRLRRGRADGTLAESTVVRTLPATRDLVADDIDGDGRVDLLVTAADGKQESIVMLRGNGDGTFVQWQSIPLPAHENEFADVVIVTGDFNGDRRRDIAAKIIEIGDLWLFLQQSDATFVATAPFSEGDHLGGMAAADLNGDGADDLLNAVATTGGVSVYLSDCAEALRAAPPRITAFASSTTSPNGRAITLTATISDPAARGEIAFYEGRILLGIAPASFTATLQLDALSVGPHNIHAVYSGDGRFSRAVSNVFTHEVTSATPQPRRRSARH